MLLGLGLSLRIERQRPDHTLPDSPLPRRGIGDSIAILEEQIAMISVALENLE